MDLLRALIAAALLLLVGFIAVRESAVEQWRRYRALRVLAELAGFAAILVALETPLREGPRPDVFLGLLPLTVSTLPQVVAWPAEIREAVLAWGDGRWVWAGLSLLVDALVIWRYWRVFTSQADAPASLKVNRWWRRLRRLPAVAVAADAVENLALAAGALESAGVFAGDVWAGVAWMAFWVKLAPFYGSLGLILWSDLVRQAEATVAADADADAKDAAELTALGVPADEAEALTQGKAASKRIRDHMLGTYRSLRFGLAGIGFVFPLFLLAAGPLWYGVKLQESMSAYYHARPLAGVIGPLKALLMQSGLPVVDRALFYLELDAETPMRAWFVGALFALGACLHLYKGFSEQENLLLNMAGGFALGVALFPIDWDCGSKCSPSVLHTICAVAAFGCLIVVAATCAKETLQMDALPEGRADLYRRRYTVMAGVMFGLTLLAVGLAVASWLNRLPEGSEWVFWVEALNMWAFATYWWIKSWEMAETNADKRAAARDLTRIRTYAGLPGPAASLPSFGVKEVPVRQAERTTGPK
ncbi:MAG TPA: hypothetical protein VFN74_02295 [Chloroflexota bacterium]|nr:hypothetical protein [Chloroflexota bacterium]